MRPMQFQQTTTERASDQKRKTPKTRQKEKRGGEVRSGTRTLEGRKNWRATRGRAPPRTTRCSSREEEKKNRAKERDAISALFQHHIDHLLLRHRFAVLSFGPHDLIRSCQARHGARKMGLPHRRKRESGRIIMHWRTFSYLTYLLKLFEKWLFVNDISN